MCRVDFPSKRTLWPGTLLRSIAKAVFVGRDPTFLYEQSWEGHIYSIQNTQGEYGTIVFGRNVLEFVGVFRSDHVKLPSDSRTRAERNSFPEPLRTVPNELHQLTHKAILYAHEATESGPLPRITSAFWSDPNTEYIAGQKPWAEILKSGASIVEPNTRELSRCIDFLSENFEFPERILKVVLAIFHRRIGRSNSETRVLPQEAAELATFVGGPAGWGACRKLLAEINIVLSPR